MTFANKTLVTLLTYCNLEQHQFNNILKDFQDIYQNQMGRYNGFKQKFLRKPAWAALKIYHLNKSCYYSLTVNCR